MDSQQIPDVPQTAGRPQKLVFETPNKAISYVALIAGILGIIGAVLTLLAAVMTLQAFHSFDFLAMIDAEGLSRIFWFTSFGLLVVTVVVSMISNAKRIGSSIITHRAEILGIITAVILIISVFVKIFP